jgi:ubiquinone/menaquinone biosynthesis C-methylase UbiE
MLPKHNNSAEHFDPRLLREELESDPELATSAISYSWIVKGQITKEFLVSCNQVLNIGCGHGRELVHLSPTTVGLDIDLQLLHTAKGISCREVVLADASHLPFRNRVFDGVAIAEVIEHLSSPLEALREMNRVLMPGGKLVLQTPNRLITLGMAISRGYGHKHEFIPTELSSYLSRTGFSVVKRTGSTIPYTPSTSRLRFLNEDLTFSIWKWLNKHLRLMTWDIIILGLKKRESH